MKRLLVVAAHFPPSTVVGAQRPFRLVRRISESGWEARVLTMPPACQLCVGDGPEAEALRPGLTKMVRCWSPWWHAHHWNQPTRGWRRMPAAVRRVLAHFTWRLIPVDNAYPWALRAARVGARLVRRRQIDMIWATGPPLTALCLARRIAMRTGVPYVVDFRDVRRADAPATSPTQHGRFNEAEEEVLRDAAGITYVAPPQWDALVARHPSIAAKPRCLVYNWFEQSEADSLASFRFDYPTILHGGSLYGGQRRLGAFLQALRLLERQQGAVPAGLQLLQLSPAGLCEHLLNEARATGVEDMIRIQPAVSRPEFLSMCRGADILLLVVGHNDGATEHAGTIPGKLYDYFAAGRPILVVGPRGCEAGKLVARLNRGLSVADDQPEEIAHTIRSLLVTDGGGTAVDLSFDSVREFEASCVLKTLADFLRQLC